MKFLKMIKSFFLNIWKVIDKLIVFPITKLIYKITSKFTKSSKKFENWFNGVRDAYLKVVYYFVSSPKKTMSVLGGIVAFILFLFIINTPLMYVIVMYWS
mgnify:CR=1 FL=1